MLVHRLALVLTASALAFVASAGASDLPLTDQATARKVYVAKCAKCHKFYEPKNYSEPDWRKWMDSMGRKSRLKPAQSDLLNQYLDAYREGQIPRTH